MAKTYYSLLIRQDGGQWAIDFGDYDRAVVEAERDDRRDHGTKAKNLAIISTAPDQASIDAAVARKNAGTQAAVAAVETIKAKAVAEALSENAKAAWRTRRAKKQSAEQAENEKAIAEAAHFTASQFLGRGKYDTREAATYDAAIALAGQMRTANGRSVLIYAVSPAGRAWPLKCVG